MKKLLKWWQGRRWEYLGHSQLVRYAAADKEKKNPEKAGVLHFYAWVNNQKKRKVEYSDGNSILKAGNYYQRAIVPWLEGADMWKPIDHPVAVRGTLINHISNLTKQPTP